MKLRKNVFRVLMIIWMIIIFMFSARNGETSGQDSHRVGKLIGKIVISGFEEWSEDEQMEFAVKVDHVVRKTSHALEYTMLGILVVGAFLEWEKNRKLQGVVYWLIGTFYAMTDEIHQLFVPGRSGQVSDVCLDSAGVMVGVGVSFLVVMIVQRRKKRAVES